MSDHGAIRIELECQVLCAALRRSWVIKDLEGHVKSCSQLSQLFPDLVTDVGGKVSGEKPHNYYKLLNVDNSVSPSKVVVAYFIAAKKFLRENNPRQKRQDYYELINAGFVLRKPRLRLSHDMIVSRADLVEQNVIEADGSFEPSRAYVMASAMAQVQDMAPPVTHAPQPVAPATPAVPSPPAAPVGEAAAAQGGQSSPPAVPAKPLPPVQIGQSGQFVQPVPGQAAQILPPGQVPGQTPGEAAAAQEQPSSPNVSGNVSGPVPQPISGAASGAVPPTGPASTAGPTSGSTPAAAPGAAPGQAPVAPPKPVVEERMPAVIELLKAARLIGPTEVLALKNQMRAFPEVSAVDLLLSAGYVTEAEMKSLQLGEFLLGQGKIDIGQFCVAMYDERMTGVKMAESLQSRGWLKAD